MQVLVADDDAVYRRLLQTTLSSWGYQAATVCDGSAAWLALQDEDAPDLVILDWVMPGMDGDQVCRCLRQLPRDRYTYVLLLSAKRDRSALLEGLEAGADDYLSKPFDPAELRARLNTGRRILRLQNELIAAREAMRRQATRDALTGAWNHAAILQILDRELNRARREGGSVGVVLADLDHFKQVNDTHGHLAGDEVLREVSARLSHAMRPDDLIGRYGGEEFLLVLPGCDAAATRKVCERLRARVADDAVSHEARSVRVTLSLGAAVFATPYELDAVGLLRAADVALYRAKAAGRNRVELAEGG
jgi:diguanylate cyclase (GGDEF)-like protein